MIIKILDDKEVPICVYADGKWHGRVTNLILSELAEIAILSLRAHEKPQQFFQELVKRMPKQ